MAVPTEARAGEGRYGLLQATEQGAAACHPVYLLGHLSDGDRISGLGIRRGPTAWHPALVGGFCSDDFRGRGLHRRSVLPTGPRHGSHTNRLHQPRYPIPRPGSTHYRYLNLRNQDQAQETSLWGNTFRNPTYGKSRSSDRALP